MPLDQTEKLNGTKLDNLRDAIAVGLASGTSQPLDIDAIKIKAHKINNRVHRP